MDFRNVGSGDGSRGQQVRLDRSPSVLVLPGTGGYLLDRLFFRSRRADSRRLRLKDSERGTGDGRKGMERFPPGCSSNLTNVLYLPVDHAERSIDSILLFTGWWLRIILSFSWA